MKSLQLPSEGKSLLTRTAFGDPAAWELAQQRALAIPPEVSGFMGVLEAANSHLPPEPWDAEAFAPCDIVDDESYSGADVATLCQVALPQLAWSTLFIFDQIAETNDEHPLLVVSLGDPPGRTFRALPEQVYSVQSNLSLGNCDWEDFANSTDEGGVYRGS